ncbi:hypothetical protein [Actinoplanes sp. NPDC051494]|uniref:hypothetical protein n=1 Tax=Actinoplanes sp. NPDC051494 TaxID=3363907 RepID=UPI0037955679
MASPWRYAQPVQPKASGTTCRATLGGCSAATDTIDRITALAPETIVVDLAAVTFAGSMLAGFVAGLHPAVPAAAASVFCRPVGGTRMRCSRT